MRRDKPQTPLAEIIASNIADGTAIYEYERRTGPRIACCFGFEHTTRKPAHSAAQADAPVSTELNEAVLPF